MAFENFHKIFGQGKCFARPSPQDLKRHKKLDPELLEEWQQHGWCSYADGALWLVRPDEFTDCVREWFPRQKKLPVVFGRAGFGDLLMLRGRSILHLHVHDGQYVDMGEAEFFLFLDAALDRDFVKVALDGKLTKDAVRKLGKLKPDEMFTFEPALALGGAPKLKNVAKVAMLPQLSFLAQIHGGARERKSL
jgi:hypothetical protein